MIWINNFFGVLILNSITGGLAHLGWFCVRKYLERRNKIRLVYPLLKIVIVFYSIPFIYTVLTLTKLDFKGGYSVNGIHLLITPVIAKIIKYIAIIWFIGMLWNFVIYFVEYMKLRIIMKWNIKITNKEMRAIFVEVYKELDIKEKVSFCHNYSLTSPIVIGTLRKTIVLPDRPYCDKELKAVLYHEFTHVLKKDLLFKKISIFLSLIIWFNPFIHSFKKDFEEWSETDCDLRVCYFMKYPLELKKYFNYALRGLHDNYNLSLKLAMQFNNDYSLKRRVLRMKHYKKEKEPRGIVAAAIIVAFSLICTSTALAAGKGAMGLYEAAYEGTKEEVLEENGIVQNELTEYVMSPEDYEGIDIVYENGSPRVRLADPQDFTWTIPANTQKRSAGFSKSSGSIEVEGYVNKAAKVGIIEPDGTFRYVNENGAVDHTFTVNKSGMHFFCIQNNNSTSITFTGFYALK